MGQSEKNRTMGKRKSSKDLHQEDPVQKTANFELAAQIRQILRDRRHPGRYHRRTDGDPSGFGLQVIPGIGKIMCDLFSCFSVE